MRSFLKSVVHNGVGELGSRVPLIIAELFIAKTLGIALYGVWAIIQLLVNYNNFSHFGLLSGLAKLEPMNLSGGKVEYLDGIRSNAFWPVFVVDIILILLAYILGFFVFLPEEFEGLVVALIFLIVMQQLFLYAQVRLQNIVDFKLLSFAKLTYSVIFMGLVLACPGSLTLQYLVYSWAGAFAVVSAFIYLKAGLLPNLSVNLDYLNKLWSVGFPIFLMGIVKLFLISMDKLFLIAVYAPSDVGAYNISLQAMLIMTVVIGLLSRVFSPVYLNLHSECKEQSRDFYLGVKKSSFMGGVVIAAFCSLGFIFVIDNFLPEYQGGIIPGVILIFSGIYQGGIQLSITSAIANNKEVVLLYCYLALGLVYALVLYSLTLLSSPLWYFAVFNLLFWLILEVFISKRVLGEELSYLLPPVILLVPIMGITLGLYHVLAGSWVFYPVSSVVALMAMVFVLHRLGLFSKLDLNSKTKP